MQLLFVTAEVHSSIEENKFRINADCFRALRGKETLPQTLISLKTFTQSLDHCPWSSKEPLLLTINETLLGTSNWDEGITRQSLPNHSGPYERRCRLLTQSENKSQVHALPPFMTNPIPQCMLILRGSLVLIHKA